MPPKGGSAAGQCVTGVGHKIQLPLGPSTSDASANWDLAGKARSKCVTDVGHKVQPPLGPSTSRLSGKLGFVEVSILCPEGALALPSREGGSRSETGELKT